MRLDDRVTIATPEGIDVDLVLAGLASRFVARLLDSVIQLAIILSCLFGAGLLSLGGGSGWSVAIGWIVLFLTMMVYDIAFELLNHGRTIGKLAVGLRVVGREGQPVDFLSSTIRNTIRIVDFLPGTYLVGAISILTSAHDQRLGDLAGGTLVVRERFGARTDRAAVPAPSTVPPEAVLAWDTTAISPGELQVVRRFLDRRLSLPWPARSYLAWQLAVRLGPKVPGLVGNEHPEYVLEGILTAKQSRL